MKIFTHLFLNTFLATVTLYGLLMLYPFSGAAQLTPYNPQRLSELEKKLQNVEIKQERATVLLDLHDQLMYSDPARAYNYNRQAFNLAKELKNDFLLARAYGNTGNENFDAGNLDMALQNYLISSTLIDINEQPLLMALNFSNMANVFALKGDYPTSLEYFYRAIDLTKKSPTGLNLGCHTRANLGECYIYLEQFEKAEYLLQLNLEELKTIQSPTVKAMTLANLGMVYRNKKKPRQAIAYFESALKETEPHGLNYFTASICANLSDLFLITKQPLEGLPFARRAKQLSTEHQDAQVQSISSRNMAKLFLAQNMLDSAFYYSKLALSITQRKGIQTLMPTTLITYAQVLKELKQYKESVQAMQQANAISDSIFSEEIKIESTNRLEAFSLMETHQNMDHFYAGRINRARTTRSITGIAIGLAFLIGLGIYSLYRQRQTINLVLTKQGAAIEAQRTKLFNLNLVKDQLFSAIANELRTPLAAIQGVLTNLEKGVNVFEENHGRFLHQLQQQTIRTITLLEDLLFTARVQMQQYQPLRQEFALKTLIDDLDKNIRLLSNGNYLPVLYHVPPDLNMYSDPTMLKMVIRNLLLNVAQGPGKDRVPVTLSAWRNEDLVTIRISDVEEDAPKVSFDDHQEGLQKPYWDLSLIKTFIENAGGNLIECPNGKGYELVLPDAQGA